jgi:hypothetical protein
LHQLTNERSFKEALCLALRERRRFLDSHTLSSSIQF